jgi:haloalkane dehalogenase
VQLVEELDLRNIHLVVHDWGGAIGMGTALRLPERFSSFTILNTAAFHLPHIPFRINICKIPLFGEIAIRGCNGFAWPATWMAIHQQDRMTPEIKRGFLAPYDNWQTRRATHDFILDIPMQKSHPSWDTLNEVSEGIAQFRDKPMNIFWGKTDFCFNDFFLAEWQRRFPKATVHTYDDAGHYVLEDAFERIIPQLATFLHNLKLESHK